MISLPFAAALVAAVLPTAFLSGIFGMAGGMILMGILLAIMPLAAAMVLHGFTQMASNGWRAWLWRAHIHWPVVGTYAVGALLAAGLFAALQLAPSKSVALITIGLMPFLGMLLPSRLAPNVAGRWQGCVCGAICTVLMFMAGVSGPIFDVFFVRSNLDRREIIATKAVIQTLGHFLKIAYFGQLLAGTTDQIAPAAVFLVIALAVIGTQLSRRVLDLMSDAQFRRWSRSLIAAIAAVYLIQGLILLFDPHGAALAAAATSLPRFSW
jgi:uncharacterized membrane protein YfcA